MAETRTEVVVDLRHAPDVVFREPNPPNGNYVRFRLSPDVAIAIGARAKRAGEGMVGEPVELAVVEQSGSALAGMDAYERLIGDAMDGDATFFARQDAVEAAWAIVEPVLHKTAPLFEYDCGTWGPAEADALVRDVGGWT
jgi:glucose-6-phosphate 1-dehydrogenase